MPRKRIILVIYSLRGGGAERVLVHLAKALDRRVFEVSIALLRKEGVYFDDLPKDVKIYSLDYSISHLFYGFGWMALVYKFRNLFKSQNPDLVISFTWYINFVIIMLKVLRLVRSGVIVTEHNTLSITRGKMRKLLRAIIVRFAYPWADGVVAISSGIYDQFVQLYNLSSNRVSLIYNPVDIKNIERVKREQVDHPWFHDSVPLVISVGRLHPQKGHSYLVRALSILRQEMKVRLVILGEGQERSSLEQQIANLELHGQVDLLGFQRNPYKYLAKGTVFVLSSLHEGFPVALVEAMAVGIACVATRCPTGPEDIICDSVNGLLVPPADEIALADAMRRLLIDVELRKKLSEAGKKRVEDFSLNKIIKQYEELIMNVS